MTAFATTSGTTAEPKLVPVTAAWLARMAALVRLWMLGAQRDHPRLLSQAPLTIVSPAIEGCTPRGVPVGALSGLLHRSLPAAVRRAQAVPYAAHLIVDADARAFVLLRLGLARAVSVIGTPNATTLVRLAQVARRQADSLLRAIHDGTLGIPWPAFHEEPGLDGQAARRALAARLEADPARARALGAAARARGALRLQDAWPELALIGCWLGGTAGHHTRRLVEDYGGVPLRDLGLVASEGRVTLPLADGTAAGPPALDAGFFEFIPEEAMETRDPPVLLAHELEVGHRYGVVLSGANGLYRYDLNDVVEVQGRHHRAPLLAFVRKGRDMTSITGEKLHVNHVRDAVRQAEDATRVEVWQYRLIPDVDACRYDLLVEPGEAGLDAIGAEAFARAFDEGLGRVNVEYAREAADAPARRAAAHRHAPGLGRAAVPGRVRAGAARRPAQVACAGGGLGSRQPRRRDPNLGGEGAMRRAAASRIGQALLLWVAVGGPILLWWPAALRLPALWAVVALGVLANALQPSYRLRDAARTPVDRGTFHQIMLTVYGTQAAALVELVLRRPPALPFDALGVGALLAMGAGLGLRTWAVATLGGWFTLQVGVKPAQRLVQAGPYRLIRHPSYTGAFVALIASARPPARVGDGGPGGNRALRGVPAPDPPRGAAAGGGTAGVPALHGPDGGATAAVRTRACRAATTHPAGPRRG